MAAWCDQGGEAPTTSNLEEALRKTLNQDGGRAVWRDSPQVQPRSQMDSQMHF